MSVCSVVKCGGFFVCVCDWNVRLFGCDVRQPP